MPAWSIGPEVVELADPLPLGGGEHALARQVVELAGGEWVDRGVEVDADLAHQLGEAVELVGGVCARVGEDDPRDPAADQLVAAEVLKKAAVGDVPEPVP